MIESSSSSFSLSLDVVVVPVAVISLFINDSIENELDTFFLVVSDEMEDEDDEDEDDEADELNEDEVDEDTDDDEDDGDVFDSPPEPTTGVLVPTDDDDDEDEDVSGSVCGTRTISPFRLLSNCRDSNINC